MSAKQWTSMANVAITVCRGPIGSVSVVVTPTCEPVPALTRTADELMAAPKDRRKLIEDPGDFDEFDPLDVLRGAIEVAETTRERGRGSRDSDSGSQNSIPALARMVSASGSSFLPRRRSKEDESD